MLFAVDARLVALLLCSANVVALATRAGRVIALAGSSSSTSPPPLILSAGARSQCVVPATDGRSFPEYLLSRASDGPLLQLPPAATVPDPDGAGLYSCAQQPVNFFALSVVTTFRERIVRDPSTCEVIIDVIDASIDLGDETPKGPLLLVRDLAAAAQTRGRTVLSWTSAADGGWTLSGTLELTFTMPSMPIVGGRRVFESVGSRVVRQTCESRLTSYLENLRDAFSGIAAPSR